MSLNTQYLCKRWQGSKLQVHLVSDNRWRAIWHLPWLLASTSTCTHVYASHMHRLFSALKRIFKVFGIGVWGGVDTEIIKLKSEILVTVQWLPYNPHTIIIYTVSIHMTRYLPENVESLSKSNNNNKKPKQCSCLDGTQRQAFKWQKFVSALLKYNGRETPYTAAHKGWQTPGRLLGSHVASFTSCSFSG